MTCLRKRLFVTIKIPRFNIRNFYPKTIVHGSIEYDSTITIELNGPITYRFKVVFSQKISHLILFPH